MFWLLSICLISSTVITTETAPIVSDVEFEDNSTYYDFEDYGYINGTDTNGTDTNGTDTNVSSTIPYNTTIRPYYTTVPPKNTSNSDSLLIVGIFGGLAGIYILMASCCWVRNNNICNISNCLNRICCICFLEWCCNCCDETKYTSNYTGNPEVDDTECPYALCCSCPCTECLSCEDNSLYTQFLVQKSCVGSNNRYHDYYQFKQDRKYRKLLEKPKTNIVPVSVPPTNTAINEPDNIYLDD